MDLDMLVLQMEISTVAHVDHQASTPVANFAADDSVDTASSRKRNSLLSPLDRGG